MEGSGSSASGQQNNRQETSLSVEAIVGAVASAVRQSLSSPSVSASSQPSQPSSIRSTSTSTTFERACELRSAAKRPKFQPPSLFENLRSRSRGTKKKASAKITSYVRDAILLPMDFKTPDGDIVIPRAARRTKLGKAGLVGKIEIDSSMTDSDVCREVCEVFATPMGYSI